MRNVKYHVEVPIMFANPGSYFSSKSLSIPFMRVEAESMGLVLGKEDFYTHQWYEKIFYQLEFYQDFIPLEISFFFFGWEGSLSPTIYKMYHFKKLKPPLKGEEEYEKKLVDFKIFSVRM